MGAAMGTCDCQTVLTMEGGEGAHAASTALPLRGAEGGTQKHRHSQGLVCTASTWGWGISCLDRQTHRHSSAFVPYFGKWAPGASPASESPSMSSPQPVSLGQWVASACQQPGTLAQPPGMGEQGAAQGPVKPARVEVLREWGFSELGTMLKGRSVTRWSRGRHQSNKWCLHKVTTWVFASLSSLRTKSCRNQEGNSLVGSLSVSLLSRNSWEGEGIPRICPSVQGQ